MKKAKDIYSNMQPAKQGEEASMHSSTQQAITKSPTWL